jgi:hypothetical protein
VDAQLDKRKYLKDPEQRMEAETVIIEKDLTIKCIQCVYWIYLSVSCGIGLSSM